MPSEPTRIVIEPPFCGAAEAPVAAGRRALAAGIAGPAPGDATLHAIDVAEGRVAWATTFPSDAYARDLATSLPLPRRDGGAWLAVHQFDGGVVIHGVDGQGRIDARIDLPDEYPLSGASDSGSKVMLRLAATTGGGVLCAWTYRQVRRYGITHHDDGGAAIWSAPEWLLACDGDTVITCPVPRKERDGGVRPPSERIALVARDARTGEVRWQSEERDVTVAGLAHGTLYLCGRAAAFDDARAQEAAVEARFLAGAIAEDALEAEWDRCLPRVAMRVRAVDAATGKGRWSMDAGAQVLGVVAGPDGVAALCHELDGTLHLRCAGTDGAPRARTLVETAAPCDPRTVPSVRAAVLAAGDSVVAFTAARWAAFGFDGVLRATGAVPAPCFGFEPRISDRWLTMASAVLVDGRLVLREGRNLWIVPAE